MSTTSVEVTASFTSCAIAKSVATAARPALQPVLVVAPSRRGELQESLVLLVVQDHRPELAVAARSQRRVRQDDLGHGGALRLRDAARPAERPSMSCGRCSTGSVLDAKWGDWPCKAMALPEFRPKVLNWLGLIPGDREHDHLKNLLHRLVGFGHDRGYIGYNHVTDIPNRYKGGDRREIIWHTDELDRMEKAAPPQIARAVLLAAEFGLRKGDLIDLPMSEIKRMPDGFRYLRVQTAKRDRWVTIPVTERAGRILDASRDGQEWVIETITGVKWDPRNLTNLVKVWQKTLGIRPEVLRFNDLRGTAATRLYQAGLGLQDLALFMGWTEQTAAQMLQVYAAQDPNRARDILRRLEAHEAKMVEEASQLPAHLRIVK
jgi:integrase